MGDPVEDGIALDKVHRTRLDVKLLLFFIGDRSANDGSDVSVFWQRFE